MAVIFRNTKAISFLGVIVFTSACGKVPQKDLWWTYLADYDNRPGSIVLNLSLKERAPITNYPHLIVTGVSYIPSNPKGLPDGKELNLLNSIGEKRLKLISELTPAILAGTFTQNGERLDYIYVSNITGVEDGLKNFYKDNYPTRTPYINLKDDSNWEAYLEFLFPNEKTLKFYRRELIQIGYFKN